jgi:hypothetical protein
MIAHAPTIATEPVSRTKKSSPSRYSAQTGAAADSPGLAIYLAKFARLPFAKYLFKSGLCQFAKGPGGTDMVASKQMSEPATLEENSLSGAAEQLARMFIEHPPRIERRHVSRARYQTRAWVQPYDETGAIRSPVIFTRDLDPHGLGFIARQDLAVLGRAVLHLPACNGATVRVRCRIRRSRDIAKGWFEGVVQFDHEQLRFAVPRIRHI